MTAYNDITQGFNQYMNAVALRQSKAQTVLTRFGMIKPIPKNNTQSYQFRRPQQMAATVAPLAEGITPTALTFGLDIVTGTIRQYGNYVPFTDVLEDTSTYNKIVEEISEQLGEQAARSIEKVAYNALRAGTAVIRANGAARTDINTPISIKHIRSATRTLETNQAMKTRPMVSAGSGENTTPVGAAYIAICHPFVESDIRDLQGFVPVEKYARPDDFIQGNGTEIGKVEGVRFITSNAMDAFADGGAARGGSGVNMYSTTGTSADVFPVLIFGQDAFVHCGLMGMAQNSIRIFQSKPTASSSDPLAQRGTLGWKTWHDTKIVNDLWMIRLEVAVTDLA